MNHTSHTTLDRARDLLGMVLVRDLEGVRLSGRILEVEAYLADDPASHSYRGETVRNKSMFGPPGRAYVYRSYGIHWCMNIVTSPVRVGEGVLIRALEPLEGIEVMIRNRNTSIITNLTSGPGKLTQALGITGELDGHDLRESPLWLEEGKRVPAGQIISTTRIGITRGADLPYRFYIKDNLHISKK